MSHVLITGGAGFIGSHLCEHYLRAGHTVLCVDNLLSGSMTNIQPFLSHPNFSFVEHDLTLPLPATLVDFAPDTILHFACPASPNPNSPVSYMAHPVETLMVTSLGSKHLLDLAKECGAQIVLASTSEVYGDPEIHPQPETYRGNVNSTGLRACYDEGKRFMEAIAMVYHREFGVKTKLIRIFNTYGPRMRLDDGRFTINLINSYLNQTPFAMHGEMSALSRSFCYIDDLIRGIDLVVTHDELIGDVLNLGNPVELTLREALDIFESITNTLLPKVQVTSMPDDPRRRRPDITKAKQILGWEPQIDFATGIKKTLESYLS